METFVLSYGGRWNRFALQWALRRLDHRGNPARIARSSRMDLYGFGGRPVALRDRDLRLWVWGINDAAQGEIPRLVRDKQTAEQLPLRFPHGLILSHDRNSGNVQIHLGNECPMPVHFARRGRSLFVAPEMKAFSDLPDRKRIKRLEQGCSLFFDPIRKEARVSEAQENWKPIPLTDLGYEACKREVSGLLEGGMQHIGKRHAGPIALSLSGGLDSSIAAWLAHKAEMECQAFTVWFDSRSGAPPPDLMGARLTCGSLGIPLHEIRIGPEDIEGLARETVYLIEETYWRHVETGTYVLRLIRELQARGFDSMLTGLGGDGYFAGRVFPSQLNGNFQKNMAANRRRLFVLSKLSSQLGMRLLSPFCFSPVRDFTLTLPASFLVEEKDGKIWGKKILRDLYAGYFSSPLVSGTKDFPFNTAGAETLYRNEWGTRMEREALYTEWLETMLEIPKFRRPSPKLSFFKGFFPKGRAR